MVRVTLNLRVQRIRWRGHEGSDGLIFVGLKLDDSGSATGENTVVRVDGRTMRGLDIFENDIVQVTGVPESYQGKPQIFANGVILLRPYGENLLTALSSGRFKGIGPKKAQELLEKFGPEQVRIHLDNGDTNALTAVLTTEMATALIGGWRTLNAGDVLFWLDRHRIPAQLGQKIVDFYGETAAEKLERDPYRLLAFNQSWRRVDGIARENLGIRVDDPRREHAAVVEALYKKFEDNNDTAVNGIDLVEATRGLLRGSIEQAERAVACCYDNGGFVRFGNLYQSRGAHQMERAIARRIAAMVRDQDFADRPTLLERPVASDESGLTLIRRLLDDYEQQERAARPTFALSGEQREAVFTALTNSFSVITGGAGVGKTTVLEALYYCISKIEGPPTERVIAMALAGRAANRMTDITGLRAMTIAGFLENGAVAEHLRRRPIIVVDEASMLDVPLLFKLLMRIPRGCRLVLVGDDYQLPPINAGLTFHVFCRADIPVPKARLTRIYRQDEQTGIPSVSRSIREGRMPSLPYYNGIAAGVSIIPCGQENVRNTVLSLYNEMVRVERSPLDVCILATTRANNGFGTAGLNQHLFDALVKSEKPVTINGAPTGHAENSIIMFTKNDAKRQIYNGSRGIIHSAFDKGKAISASSESGGNEHSGMTYASAWVEQGESKGSVTELSADDLSTDDRKMAIERGYAATVHKGQGSQWERVIVPITESRLLDRALIYTAVTRAKVQVVLVGDIDAMRRSVELPPLAFNRTICLDRMLLDEMADDLCQEQVPEPAE